MASLLFLLLTFLGAAKVVSAQGVATTISELPPDVAARLKRQIETGSNEEKRTALFEIRNLGSASASRIALPALRDKDELVRATAAASIVFVPRSEAGAALIPLLADKAEFVRREASYALGEVLDASAVTPLIRIVRSDKILEVRSAAAIALGKIGEPAAIEPLVAVLKTRPKEDYEFLRRSAARSIGQIAQVRLTGDPGVVTPQNFLPEKFKELGGDTAAHRTNFAPAVDVLISSLRNKNESDDTRREAAFSLGAIGDARATAALQSYLSDPDPYLAEICKEALLKIDRRNKPASGVSPE